MSRAAPEAYATGRLTERRVRPISPPPNASPQTSQTTRSSGIPSATSPCEVWSFPPLQNGPAFQQAREGYEGRVDDRDGEYDRGDDHNGKEAPGQAGCGRERETGEHQAGEEGTAVAHEDAGGRVVVDEESHQRPCERKGHAGQRDITSQKKIDAHEGSGDGAHTTRQADLAP